MPSGPFGKVGVNQTLMVGIVIEEDTPFSVPQGRIEDRFRSKSSLPRADVRVDDSIRTVQRVIWETRTDEISVWNIQNFMSVVSDEMDIDMELMEQITSVVIG